MDRGLGGGAYDVCGDSHRVRPLGRGIFYDVARSGAAPPSAREHPAELTPREVEVLGLVAEGLTNPQVAQELFLSPRTVQRHLNSVYRKLGVSSRAAATRLALEHDLL